MGRICRRESLSKVGDDFPSILVHRVRFRARPPPTDKHHKRRSTLNKFSQGEKAAGTGSWKRENGRETKWNLLKIGERRLEERKTPTWRDSNARSDSERDFHSPRGYSSSMDPHLRDPYWGEAFIFGLILREKLFFLKIGSKEVEGRFSFFFSRRVKEFVKEIFV